MVSFLLYSLYVLCDMWFRCVGEAAFCRHVYCSLATEVAPEHASRAAIATPELP
jgi:hypothetical protein